MARMTNRRDRNRRAKRGTFITTPARGYALRQDYWPQHLGLTPIPRYTVQPWGPRGIAPRKQGGRGAVATRARPRRATNAFKPVSGMHDTPFKRPSIAPYGVWLKGLAYLPGPVKRCVQRKQRRQAVFSETGGGSIRRKSTNRRTPESDIRCL